MNPTTFSSLTTISDGEIAASILIPMVVFVLIAALLAVYSDRQPKAPAKAKISK